MSFAPSVEKLRETKPSKYLPPLTSGRISKVYDGLFF